MNDNNSINSFFQENQVLDLVVDISKDLNSYKTQVLNNSFNNISLVETKLESLQNYIQFTNNRLNSETSSLYNSCKNQFDFISNQFTNLLFTGSNVDTKVQNIEKRIDTLYDDLRRFETNVNERLNSFDETKIQCSTQNQHVLNLNNKFDMIYQLVCKNDAKLDQMIIQRDSFMSTRNQFDTNDQSFKDRKQKYDEAYQNLNSNQNLGLPKFSESNNIFNMNLENFDGVDKKFEFNTFPKGLDLKPNTINTSDSNYWINGNQQSNQTNKQDRSTFEPANPSGQISTQTTAQKNTKDGKSSSMSKVKNVIHGNSSKFG